MCSSLPALRQVVVDGAMSFSGPFLFKEYSVLFLLVFLGTVAGKKLTWMGASHSCRFVQSCKIKLTLCVCTGSYFPARGHSSVLRIYNPIHLFFLFSAWRTWAGDRACPKVTADCVPRYFSTGFVPDI